LAQFQQKRRRVLNFPEYLFKLRRFGEVEEIWDEIRRRWVVLTPEEWVRQHAVRYLREQKGYPAGRIAVERGLKVNGMQRRTDAVVYDAHGQPHMIVECKAPNVAISQSTFDQIARYNLTLRVPYLYVTNGHEHFCCRIDFGTSGYDFLSEVPAARE
jgi:hypothetical protein